MTTPLSRRSFIAGSAALTAATYAGAAAKPNDRIRLAYVSADFNNFALCLLNLVFAKNRDTGVDGISHDLGRMCLADGNQPYLRRIAARAPGSRLDPFANACYILRNHLNTIPNFPE